MWAMQPMQDEIRLHSMPILRTWLLKLDPAGRVSNEIKFLRTAFDHLWRARGKQLYTSEQFADLIERLWCIRPERPAAVPLGTRRASRTGAWSMRPVMRQGTETPSIQRPDSPCPACRSVKLRSAGCGQERPVGLRPQLPKNSLVLDRACGVWTEPAGIP